MTLHFLIQEYSFKRFEALEYCKRLIPRNYYCNLMSIFKQDFIGKDQFFRSI